MRWSRLLALGFITAMTGCRVLTHTPPANVSPISPDTNLSAALAHYSQGIVAADSTPVDHHKAIKHFERALSIDPDRWRVIKRLAKEYTALKRVDDTQGVLEQACRSDASNFEARIWLTRIYQEKKLHEATIESAKLAIALKPDNTEAYLRLIRTLIEAENYPEIFPAIDAASTNTPHTDLIQSFVLSLGKALNVDKQYAYAIECFQRVLQQTPENIEGLTGLLHSHTALNDLDEQIAALKRLVDLKPSDVGQLFLLGEVYESAERYADAESIYESLIEKSPTFSEAYSRSARLQISNSRRKEGIATLNAGISAFPDSPSLFAMRAMVWTLSNDYDKAIKDYETAERLIKSGPNKVTVNGSFYYSFGTVCDRAGQPERAQKLMEQCIAVDDNAHSARNYLAYMWAEQSVNLTKARTYIELALEADPKSGAYVDTYGWVLYQQKEYTAALTQLLHAYDLIQDDPVISEHIGDCYHKLGEPNNAKKWWKRSLKLSPENATLRDRLNNKSGPKSKATH